jgi:hypothetical protein
MAPEAAKMKRKKITIGATAVVAGLIMLGTSFGLGHSSSIRGKHREKQNQIVRGSVIKVHTDRGVIILPGRADSWDAVEHAEFVADSLADVQMVNNEVAIYGMGKN